MNKSNAIRCSNCNLVNFATAPFCKRCKMSFENPANPPQPNTVNININIPVPVENINLNTPFNEPQKFRQNFNEMPQFQPNQQQFGNPQTNYFQDTDSYQPQNQQGFEQWQQMNPPTNVPMHAPMFPHPRQMPTNGIFRNGKEVVVHRNASMPDNCVKCGEHLQGYNGVGGFARQKYRWHNPLVYIALISPLIYAILSLVLSQKMTVDIPLCYKHLEERKTNGSYLVGASILSVFAIFFFGSLGYVGFSFLLFFAAIIGLPLAYEYTFKPLQASKIENDYIYLKGASEEYIRNLPYC